MPSTTGATAETNTLTRAVAVVGGQVVDVELRRASCRATATTGRSARQFLNYWNLNFNGGWRHATLDDRLTRGGPSAASPALRFWNVNGGTDSRHGVLPVRAMRTTRRPTKAAGSGTAAPSLNIKPSPKVTISTGPVVEPQSLPRRSTSAPSPMPTATHTYGSRYVFGLLDQSQLTMTTRVSLILTPRVSVQVFASRCWRSATTPTSRSWRARGTFDFLHYGASQLAFDRRRRAATPSIPTAPTAAPRRSRSAIPTST